MKPARTVRPELYRKGFAVVLILIAGILLIGLTFFVFRFSNVSPKSVITNVLTKPSPSPAVKTYETQNECESTTGKSCTILMCDVVPEGKTFEEACGIGFKTGWAPTKSNSNLQPSSPDETANWKTYTSKTGKFEIKYPTEMAIFTEEVNENNIANLILHSSTSFAFSVTVFGTSGNAVCNPEYKSKQDIFESLVIDGVEGCFIEGKNVDTPNIEGRTYYLVQNGWLYTPGFTWKTGEKDNVLMDKMISTLKFL